ncbi:MAG: FliH/SctL family protein [Firmicutes bacterium]|nr:FliH/SctL family protein [Bacillota bacterium]
MSKVIKRTAIDDAFVRSPAFLVPTERPGLSLPECDEDEFVLETEDDVATAIHKAEAQAREIVAKSRQEAERIIQDAVARSEHIVEQAEAEGYEQGRAAGLAEVREAYAEALDAIRSAADVIVATADATVSQCEREIAELAIAVAEKVICKTLNEDPEAVLAVVREAVRRAEGSRTVVIRVSPEDLGLIASARDELIGFSPDLRHMEIVEDARIKRGGCLIEMEVGAVDARVDEQLRDIELSFLEEAKHAG